MNTGRNPTEPPASEWSLEPIEDAAAQPGHAAPGPSTFHAESRSSTDRRKGGDRRQTLRFEPDRRSGKDRRPRGGWGPGKNL